MLAQWQNSALTEATDGSVYNDVWGFYFNGNKYAAIGSTEGTHIIQVENNQLTEIAFVAGAAQGPNVINRDVFEYKGYVYAICDDGYSSLQVIDLHYLPDSAHVVFESDSFFQRAHSVFIDTSSARMYICGPNSNINGSRAMDVFSLANPEQPLYLSSYPYAQYVHDCFVRNDTAWLNCGPEGLQVVNYSNPLNPIVIGDLSTYTDMGYNHSGWLSDDGKYYVFTDETAGKKIKLCNVQNLNDIRIVSFFNSESDANTIAHNPMISGKYVYLSHYYDGLQIFDISDPENVYRAGWYDTHLENSIIYSGAWGVFHWKDDGKIMISDRQQGLMLFEFNPPVKGMEQQSEHGVYPNPADKNVWFWISNTRHFSYALTVFDLNGKQIYSSSFYESNNYFLDVSQWSEGVYYYRLTGIDRKVEMNGKMVIIHQ